MQANWFIALPFPPTALPVEELERLPAGTRGFHPDDLHVTVAFLGAVGERRALRAWRRLGPGNTLSLHATLGARAVFGPPRRPSALGLEVDGANGEAQLRHFIAAWRDILREAADLDADPRTVRPHVTLGRPPRRPDADWNHELTAWLDCPAIHAPVCLDRIALYTRANPDAGRRFREVRCSVPPPPDDATS
jgi:2'-5' RNA ligase